MSSTSSKKARLLALQAYLYQSTDDLHPVTMQEIIDELTAEGYPADRKTIRDDILILQSFGVDIIPNRSRENTYFIGSREFELPELKLLIDAVSSARFIPVAKSNQLIEKLSLLASQYQKDQLIPRIYTSDKIKTENTQLYYIIDDIVEAIQSKRKIRFQYIDFDRNKNRILHNDGEVYLISPYACIWNNDFYYLVAYSDKKEKVITFRIDRITQLSITEEAIHPEPDGFSATVFANKAFKMYDSIEQEVELIASNELMKYIIERFKDKTPIENVSETEFKATVTVSVSVTFYSWVFGFEGRMKITGPETVKSEYINMLMLKKIMSCQS